MAASGSCEVRFIPMEMARGEEKRQQGWSLTDNESMAQLGRESEEVQFLSVFRELLHDRLPPPFSLLE